MLIHTNDRQYVRQQQQHTETTTAQKEKKENNQTIKADEQTGKQQTILKLAKQERQTDRETEREGDTHIHRDRKTEGGGGGGHGEREREREREACGQTDSIAEECVNIFMRTCQSLSYLLTLTINGGERCQDGELQIKSES